MFENLLTKPVWQMTGEELLSLINSQLAPIGAAKPEPERPSEKKKAHVFGIAGIARYLGCSVSKVNRLKKAGVFNRALKQYGRGIIADCDTLLECYQQKKGGRR